MLIFFTNFMNKKNIVSSLLLFTLALTGCSSQVDSKDTKSKETASNSQNTEEVAETDKIEIIDFHSTRRCFSCQTIEKFTQSTLEEFFQPELRDGKITFQSINVEEPQNQAIVQKYQARGSSLFINSIIDGKDNLLEDTQVWRLVQNEQAYKKYLKEKIENLLNLWKTSSTL